MWLFFTLLRPALNYKGQVYVMTLVHPINGHAPGICDGDLIQGW